MEEQNKNEKTKAKTEEKKDKQEMTEFSQNEEKSQKNQNLEQKFKELEEKLKKTEEQAKKISALYQTLQQDFEKFKVRTIKEKEEAKDEGLLKIVKGLLDIIDNFEKAIESAKVSDDVSALSKGIQMIHYQLVKFLQDNGIQEIIVNGEFDPNLHEVLDTYKTNEYKPNQIVKVLQKGYIYKGKVIRPAKVVVAVPVEEEETEDIT
ncbi:MAG TPA: nucleotide exchange factor GrpE [Hydrogenothermaceae bacterium]|nr:nucleotide exchange factor GrpE [Hydrogenothermaceae bacterium]